MSKSEDSFGCGLRKTIALRLLSALRWFPLQGGNSIFLASNGGGLQTVLDIVWHLTLPALTLVFLLGSLGILAANFAVELAYRSLGPRRVA